MAISFSVFILSLTGIASLLSFSVWEKKRGTRLFVEARAKLDSLVVRAVKICTERIESLDSPTLSRAYNALIHFLAIVILRVIKILEKKMIRVLNTIRGRRELVSQGSASEFLKEVSKHKNGLGHH